MLFWIVGYYSNGQTRSVIYKFEMIQTELYLEILIEMEWELV